MASTASRSARDWYGSVGGFWRTSDGVRDPEFTADEGGQLTATLKRESDAGELVLYARYLDDKNQFITPIPVIQRGTDNFSAYPGFDPLTATYNSEAIRHVRLDGYPGGGTERGSCRGPRRADVVRRRQLRLRIRQRLVDQRQVPRQRRRRRYQCAVLRQQSRHALRRAVHHSHQSRRLRAAGGLGDGHLRRRRRGAAPTRASSTRAGGSSTRSCRTSTTTSA